MQKGIHPKYYDHAKVTCACGNKFTIGATREEISVEICHKCHPFFTGEEKLIDVAGRVEKFKARREKAGAAPKKVKKSAPKNNSAIVAACVFHPAASQ